MLLLGRSPPLDATFGTLATVGCYVWDARHRRMLLLGRSPPLDATFGTLATVGCYMTAERGDGENTTLHSYNKLGVVIN
eukprot:778177-Prorocentrum_minimum.AAC.4